MPKKRHKAIPLTGASKILRAHSTQIEPPGLLEMGNLFLSRSDNAIGLRSDWEPAYAGMFSYSSLIQGSDAEDYLNAAFHVNRAGHTIWFGRWCPFTWDGGAFGQLFTLYEEGTISTDGVKSEVIGQGTSWLQQVWPGCLIKQKGEGNNLYVVEFITTDLRLVTNEPMPGLSGAEYQIFRTHPGIRADWPIRMESLGGYLIYGTVDMAQPVNEKYISGPFYSNIGRPNLGVWFGTDPIPDEIDIPMAAISVGYDAARRGGVLHSRMGDLPPIVVGGEKGAVFARNWIGEDLRIIETAAIAGSRVTYGVSSGTRVNISYMKASDVSVEILTLEGEIIAVPTTVEDLGGYYEQYIYTEDETITKTSPFGVVELYGKCGEYYLGAGGLLGNSAGTVYTTSVSVNLRDGVEFQPGFGGTTYYVAVGDDDGTDGVILYFTAPGSISRATSAVNESFLGVDYSVYLDRVIAVGTNGTCMTSDDQGATWTSRSVGTTEDLNAIAVDDQGRCICVVGDGEYGNAQAFLSLDGISWTQVTGIGNDDLVDVSFNAKDGAFYVVSATGSVYRIRRRVRIQAASTFLGTFGDASDYVCDVQHDGAQFVAVGSKIWTSPDAITWTARATPTQPLTSVAKDLIGGSNWVAVGQGGVIYLSTNDGVTWASIASPTAETLTGVIHHSVDTTAIDFIAVGEKGTVIRSNAGTGWSAMSFPSTSDIYSISTDRTNPTANQKNLYISAQDGLIYVNQRGIAGSYVGWEAWENRPEKRYRDQEDQEGNVYGRSLNIYVPVHRPSIQGLEFQGAARLVASASNVIETFEELSDIPLNGAVRFSEVGTYERQFGDDWFPYPSWPALNAFALAGQGDFSRVLMLRVVVGRAQSQDGTIIHPQFDGFLTSTDFGLTWSTDPFPYSGRYGQPQSMGWSYADITRIGKWVFAPICSDGTDFFAIQSTSRLAIPPRAVVMSGWEISYEVAELGDVS